MVNTIEFSKLGIGPFDVNRVAFSLFGIDIYWYAIIITAGMLLAIFFAARNAKNVGLTSDNVLDIALIGIPTSVIGARLFFVLFTLDQYKSFWDVFDIRDGGLAIYGAVIVAFIDGFVYCRVKKISVLALFDLGAMGFLIGQSIGRWGNFMNAEVYGRETESIFGMSINGNGPFHPTFFYESVWNLVGFVLIFVYFKKFRKHNGEVSFLYFFWYGLGRFFLEGMRVEKYILKLGGINVDQWLAALFCVVGLAAFVFARLGKFEKKTVAEFYNEKIKEITEDTDER